MRRTIKLSISKTDEEWDIIEQKIGGKSLTDYVWPEVNKLLKQFEDTRKMMRMMGDKNQMAKLMKNMPGGMPKM